MEETLENVVTDTPPQHHDDEPKATTYDSPRKKKPGPIQVIKVALSRMGKRSKSTNSLSVDDDKSRSRRSWRKFVGSMRPLHLQETQSPSMSPHSNVSSPRSEYNITDGGDCSFYSPSPSNSRYASAIGLNEMVKADENNDNEVVVAAARVSNGDEMIDAKAEEFIAKFYNQMKMQRLNTMDRLYMERSQRSLGQ